VSALAKFVISWWRRRWRTCLGSEQLFISLFS